MICPICQQPTRRMVYKRTGKCCADCNSSNFIRLVDIVAPAKPFVDVISRMHDLASRPIQIPRVRRP